VVMSPDRSLEDLGSLLHAACRRRDLTVCDLARLSDISSEYMCDILAGKRPPTFESAERLVALLQLDHEETAVLMSAAGHGATAPFGVVHPSLVD